MRKSAVTEFFLKYFEKNRIDSEEISEKTGISKAKLNGNYKQSLSAEEFLELCFFLGIEPEQVREEIKKELHE